MRVFSYEVCVDCQGFGVKAPKGVVRRWSTALRRHVWLYLQARKSRSRSRRQRPTAAAPRLAQYLIAVTRNLTKGRSQCELCGGSGTLIMDEGEQ